MIRIRIRNGMMVHCAVMVALSLACDSEGVRPAGVRSCFQLREHGVQVCENMICFLQLSIVAGSLVAFKY